MPRSVFSYVIALCLMIASTTHTFAFHFSGSYVQLGHFTTSVQSAQEMSYAGSLQSVVKLKPAGCSDVVATKSLFAAQKMWAIASIASAQDHQRCHAGISPVVEHAGISPMAEIAGPPSRDTQPLLLTRYYLGFKDWRFKPPLRPPQVG